MISNQKNFITFQVPVLTTVLDRSQVIPSHGNGDSRTNVSQLGTPKHIPHLYPRHKQDQPIPRLSRGPGPRPNLDSKPPLLSPGLSAVLRPSPSPPPISQSRKSRTPWQESNDPSCVHTQVCVQYNKSVTWLESTTMDGPQLTHAGQMQSEPRSVT